LSEVKTAGAWHLARSACDAYHDRAAVVVVAGDEGHAVGELGGELVGHDVICSAQR